MNKDIEIKRSSESSVNSDYAGSTKSTYRLKYDAEKEVIRKKLGGLEAVRISLGLSQRKICQLLLIDPSTWSKWLKNEDLAPPSVYRTLQWYMALIEKQPEWHPQNAFLGSFQNRSSDKEMLAKITELQKQLKISQKWNLVWKLLIICNTLLFFYKIVF